MAQGRTTSRQQSSSGDARIGAGTRVRGRIDGDGDLVIEGEVEGDVSVTGILTVAAGSRVRGDLRGRTVAIEEGAQYAGRLECEFDLPPELARAGR